MKHRFNLSVIVVLLLALLTVRGAQAQAPLGTGFTYQGYLVIDGVPVTGNCDFQFSLWDALTSGAQVGSTVPKDAVLVTDGVFTVKLDFGAVFTGDTRWLEVAARCPAGSGGYTMLSPRQELSAEPYALYSMNSDKLDGQHASAFWNMGGNADSTPGTNYIGTSDNQALEIKVNGQRVMRIEPSTLSPNIINGYSGNWYTVGTYGVTILGAGNSTDPNRVTDRYGTVVGGMGNQAGDGAGTINDAGYATVSGGAFNTASGIVSTVSGGESNEAGGHHAVVGGGIHNNASGDYSVIAGSNSNIASGNFSSVLGGNTNTASAHYSAILGGLANTASGQNAVVSGGISNVANHESATIGGGSTNTASGTAATVSGGYTNTASGNRATVAGGFSNQATGAGSVVSGGYYNLAVGNYSYANGYRAQANHNGAFVWADSTDADFTSTAANQFAVRASGGVVVDVGSGDGLRIFSDITSPNLISGYGNNSVTSGVFGAVISGGGFYNTVYGQDWPNTVTDSFGTIGGGAHNLAGDNSGTTIDREFATVGGGRFNSAQGEISTIGGGAYNETSGEGSVISGGDWNTATGSNATICGGSNNSALGEESTSCGGLGNRASGDASFAAGSHARANNRGCFVWGDYTTRYTTIVECNTDNRWIARSTGGVYFYTNTAHTTGSYLAAGSGTWNSVSDRAAKENFIDVKPAEVLEKVAAMPLSTWNYISEDPAIRHMGPMAQDFHAAFGLGDSEKAIGTIDADGVALASIQALYAKTQALQAEIDALKAGRSNPISLNTSGLSLPWLLFGGLVLLNAGILLGRRFPMRNRRGEMTWGEIATPQKQGLSMTNDEGGMK